MSEWQDISTAPRGVEVDLWVNGVRLVNFHMDFHGRWCREEGYPSFTRVLRDQATHWMPLPKPPSEPLGSSTFPAEANSRTL